MIARRLLGRDVLARLPALAIAVAALVAVVDLVLPSGAGRALVALPLPVNPADVDPLDAISVAIALGALVVGLVRRKRLALWLAAAAFAGGIVGEAVTLHHPLGAAVAVGCLVVLIADHRRYNVQTDPRLGRVVTVIVVASTAILVAGSLLSDLVASSAHESLPDQVATWAIGTLDFVDPTGLITTSRPDAAFEALELAARLAVLVAAVAILAAVPEAPAMDADLRARAARFARDSLAPFQLGRDTQLFAPPGAPADRSAIAYGRIGRWAIVLGDPIGPPMDHARTFAAFDARCARHDVAVGVYQASAAAVPWLEASGFHVVPIGREAVVDLRTFDLGGGRRANLRHSISRSERGGVTVRWLPEGVSLDDPLIPRLAALDRAWRRERGPAMGFTIGCFEPAELRAAAIAVAIEADGRPSAFTTFRRAGPDGWVLDLLRRDRGATPGSVEACIAAAAIAMRAAGDMTLSLGFVALDGLEADSPEKRLLLALGRLVAPLYDVRSLAFFKAKFSPTWIVRYAAVRHRLGIVPFGIALLRLHLVTGQRADEGGRRRLVQFRHGP